MTNQDLPRWAVKLIKRILQFTRTGYQYQILLSKVNDTVAQISITEVGKIETLT